MNRVQETDSEDRKNELIQKGFILESVDGRPAKDGGKPDETLKNLKELEKENTGLKKKVEELEKENTGLKKKVEELEKEKASLKEALEKEKAGQAADQDKKGKKDA